MKQYEELGFTDDFMFCKVLTSNPHLCHGLLKLVIGRKVCAFVRLDKQQPIETTADGKGIRFDVYSEDDQGTVFDCEMQTTANVQRLDTLLDKPFILYLTNPKNPSSWSAP